MPVLKNPKHERFAQFLADGLVNGEAYERAGYNYHRSNASKLAREQSIVARVAEIQTAREAVRSHGMAKAIDEVAITEAQVLQMLMDDRITALGLEQTSAAIKAAELLGKYLGMWTEKVEHSGSIGATFIIEE